MDKRVLTVFGSVSIPEPYNNALFFVIFPTKGVRWHKDIWPAIVRYARENLGLDTRTKTRQGDFRSQELWCEGVGIDDDGGLYDKVINRNTKGNYLILEYNPRTRNIE